MMRSGMVTERTSCARRKAAISATIASLLRTSPDSENHRFNSAVSPSGATQIPTAALLAR
jgi:hypothetical protein